MKRTSVMVMATATVGVLLAGCGSGDSGTDNAADDNGMRPNTPTNTAAQTTPSPTSEPAAPSSTPESQADDAESTAPQPDPELGPASQTTCAEFKTLEGAAEKERIEQILAENPGGPFDGSPNVALGTAKLVCLADSQADKPVARAAGIVKR